MKNNENNKNESKTKFAEEVSKAREKKETKGRLEDKKKEAQKEKKSILEVKAKARFIRMAPRKVRLVINQLKSKSATESLDYLRFIRKAAVEPITKLINSAIANAENNFHLNRNDLYIKKFIVNDGPVLKRWRPRAYGRAAQILKRTSHLELILGINPEVKTVSDKKVLSKEEEKKKEEEVKIISPEQVKKEIPKVSGRGPQEKGRSQKGFLKKIFNRKTG